MESSKNKLIKLNKIMLVVTTFISIVSLSVCFYFHAKAFPLILFRYHKQEFILLLCILFLYFLAKMFEMKKIKKVIALGIILSVINLIGFRILTKIM
ncbi:hypothetical protein KQI42_07145 [Tissierella sp. MSJ-40]|uniref:Uncharacterized protein n=1 Tax=Tissierella simiarum TaxID=2841534 RepID=A0ABS6E4E5_9FIRM|nr:hypothetical protein [Tissierella simiarum]MBU5437777.1 hypothetical protein [Tissierella simiarum]